MISVKNVSRTPTVAENIYLIEIVRGLSVTSRHFFRNLFTFIGGKKGAVTIMYPEEKRDISPRWRGRHRLMKRQDGSVRCTACMLCATACPARCISIVAAEHPEKCVEKYPIRYDVDELRCVFCGLCVEACPCDAVRMDTDIISLVEDNRDAFKYTIETLLVDGDESEALY